MKTVYFTRLWEHEFGVRAEGYYVSTNKSCIETSQKDVQQGNSPDCYWTCDPIEECLCDDTTYSELLIKCYEKKRGYIWVKNLFNYDLYFKIKK